MTRPYEVRQKLNMAIVMAAEGHSKYQIAKALHMSNTTVWKHLNKAGVKAEIERLQRVYLERNLVRSVDKMTEIIHSDYDPKVMKDEDGNAVVDKTGKPVVVEDVEGRKMQYRAVEKTLEAAGVLPSYSSATFVQNLNQVNVFQTEQVKSVLKRFGGYLSGEGDSVEAEVADADK